MSSYLPCLGTDPDQFPPTSSALAEPNGLLAIGGDLSPERLLLAYRRGIFPWYSDGQPILWWAPEPRCILRPQHFHLSRSLKRRIRASTFTVTRNTCFERVMRACAAPRDYSDDTWINEEMIVAYSRLHELGWAHSFEVWEQEEMIGGIYGVAIGRIFFGESMFSARTDGSKIALWSLCQALQAMRFPFIDCQVENSHLMSLGAECLPRDEFENLLAECTTGGGQSADWPVSLVYDLNNFPGNS